MSSDKTEEATPKRLREARRKGQVPKSKELGTAAVLLATGGALVGMGETIVADLRALFALTFRAIAEDIAPMAVLDAALGIGAGLILPILLAAMLAGTVINFLQVGPLLTLEPVKPQLNRLDVIKGIKNLFSRRQLMELVKTLLKMVIVGAVLHGVLAANTRGVVGLAGQDAAAALSGTAGLVSTLLFRVGGAVLGIAVLDVFYQRWQHARDQRMSKDEVKREYKDAEGDPHAKQERDRLHREILEHDSVEQVRGADVLVVNPTHLAIALRYDDAESDAPTVLAKGQEHLAERMIRAAREAGVPIMRDVPLAHALYELERGDEIPEPLYEAVAAVLRAAWDEAGKPEER
ncbi:MAG: EscU/YscU/HrcU family type III secretion system export apparatus switch protein [Sandaracinus sp.]|nr:EscU/YscU/HrcU family type III secretion system export apparatus switch protein [Sandaracinus sp.]|tara:strand:+ start:751 stop:1797 length:1047 start_codon:yes stop_codon:yes gene_type:complete